MKRLSAHIIVDNKFLILLILVLVVNTTLVGLGYNFINKHMLLQEEEFNHKQNFAKDLWIYNYDLAMEMDVYDRSSVRDALSRLIQEVELASTGDDLARAVLAHGRRAQETILREYEARQRERVLSVINQDRSIQAITERMRMTVSVSMEAGVEVNPTGIFQDETIIEIAGLIFDESDLSQALIIEVEVEDGRAKLLHPYSPVDQIVSLNAEVDSLRLSLRELRADAGYLELTGEGIIINIYDASEGYTTEAIIHETDVRDVVNELFASGAKGVAVGGERLTATSAIRCVGPVILVNDERIAVNPVEIHAVGNAQVLESGIDIIRLSLESMRDLRFDVKKAENIYLPAYSR